MSEAESASESTSKSSGHAGLWLILLVILITCIFSTLDAAVDTVTTAAADTAAGTWELVSMTYNGMTVGKEDLEEMGTAMTLDLLEDGTGTMDYDGTVYDLT